MVIWLFLGYFFGLFQKESYFCIKVKTIHEMKDTVYIVISQRGEYEDYRTEIEKVFNNLKDARKFAKEFESEHLVDAKEEEIYSIVPKDIFLEYDWDDAEEYKGYTKAQYEAQDKRCDTAYGVGVYGRCMIEKFKVN